MGFRREIENAGEVVVVDELADELSVKDISFDDGETGVAVWTDEVISISRVGEFVENDEFFEVWPLQKLPNERRAYKACAASYKKGTE